MTTKQELFQQFEETGNLTADQAAQLIDLEGDTGEQPDTGSEPGAAPEPDAPQQDSQVPDDSDLNPDNAVILARDGKHTIGYEKLLEARKAAQTSAQEASELRGQLETTQQELERLRSESQQRAIEGEAPTSADKMLNVAEAAMDAGFDPAIFGDFSEEDLAKGIQKLVDMRVESALEPLRKKFEPIEADAQEQARAAHYQAIYDAHPDADSLSESKELSDWINAQPSFVRDGYQAVLDKGSATQVVELFDAFKNATGKASTADALQAKAKQAIDSVKPTVPASLSDIPGGTAGPGSKMEALAAKSPVDLAEAMENMSPEQIEAYLNRSL